MMLFNDAQETINYIEASPETLPLPPPPELGRRSERSTAAYFIKSSQSLSGEKNEFSAV